LVSKPSLKKFYNGRAYGRLEIVVKPFEIPFLNLATAKIICATATQKEV